MRPLPGALDVTLDGCCDHQAGVPEEEGRRVSASRWKGPMRCCSTE